MRTEAGSWKAATSRLTLNEDKTRIAKVDDGFDFLSVNIRRHHVTGGTKVLSRPSRDAMHKMRRRIADKWATGRYFGPFHHARRSNWVFGHRETGACLHQ